MPPSVLAYLESQGITAADINACFTQPPNTDDLREAVMNPTTRRLRKLTPAMLRELSEKSTFTIPSANYPENPHVFKVGQMRGGGGSEDIHFWYDRAVCPSFPQVSPLLQRGSEVIKTALLEQLAYGVERLCFVPQRFYKNGGDLNIHAGLLNIVAGSVDLLHLIFGLPAYEDESGADRGVWPCTPALC